MSGHSHWATTHRQKELNAAKRGNTFSKVTRAIAIAIKSGGSNNPETNFKLRMAIEQARAANMPKENIERAISKGATGEALEEVNYEGFGPGGIAVIIEVTTDNRNRTGQEIKNLFERAGGRLGGPGSVSFNFDGRGFMLVSKDTADSESQMLKLIDLGAEDIEETDDGLEVYITQDKLSETKKKFEDAGFKVISVDLVMRPKTYQTVADPKAAEKAIAFLETLNDLDDVQKVYANLDIPDEIMDKIKSGNA
jgi:YebC/PmpR family DNA-binding regulatory protein